MSSVRMYQDNVLLVFEPEEKMTKSGILTPDVGPKIKGTKTAKVLASGPGYYGKPNWKFPQGFFHANEVKEGDRVLVDRLAGQDYVLDISVPRHNKPTNLGEIAGLKGEFRIVRHDEILAVVED